MPSGLPGLPPTLDLAVTAPKGVLAVESKLTESLSTHEAVCADSYGAPMEKGSASWRADYRALRVDPRRYRYLDAAQLLKHYVGLRHTVPTGAITLVYLWWEPSNANQLAPFACHAAEVRDFVSRVEDRRLRLLAMPYPQLWKQWEEPVSPTWLRDHVATLRQRYDLSL